MVLDVFEKEITKGDIVCYAVTEGQTSRMRFGFVVNVTGGSDNRVTVQGYSKNYHYKPDIVINPGDRYAEWSINRAQKKWIAKKGSAAHAQVKMMIINPDMLPDDLQVIMLEDAKTLLA